MKRDDHQPSALSLRVDVVEAGRSARRGCRPCEIGADLTFSTSHLESYCLAQWEPVIFDALVVAAAVEFCDRIQRRQTQHWGRNIELRIPVHDPARWSAPAVRAAQNERRHNIDGAGWRI